MYILILRVFSDSLPLFMHDISPANCPTEDLIILRPGHAEMALIMWIPKNLMNYLVSSRIDVYQVMRFLLGHLADCK